MDKTGDLCVEKVYMRQELPVIYGESHPNQYIANIRNGAVAGFKYFKFSGVKKITVCIRGNTEGKFLITTEPYGKICAEIFVGSGSGESKVWKDFTGKADIPDEVYGLFFRFEGKGSVDFLSFELE